MSDGYHQIRAACEKCSRFVKDSEVKPIAYYADSGFYGEVIDGHDSHPQCGERVPVRIVLGRFVQISDEERDDYFAQIEAMNR